MADARYAIPFDELRLDQVELVGGKCANLGELTQAGFPVPPGFAVTTAAYERDDIDAAVGDGLCASSGAESGSAPTRRSPSARARSPRTCRTRASPACRTPISGSAALDAVLDGVRRCWASFFNPEAIAYREAHGITRGGMSVAVQYMVDARVAGVMFTLNPVSGDPSSIAIDASYGLGISVVGGEVTPDSFLVSKVTREIVRRQIGAKEIEVVADPAAATTVTRDVPEELRAQPCLTDEEIVRLAELGRRVEAHYARAPGRRVGDRPPARRALPAPDQARDGVEQQAAAHDRSRAARWR